MVEPYLPDIIEGVVARVNAVFSTRATDPFNVFFEKGNYQQVNRELQKNDPQHLNSWMIWLPMPFNVKRGNFKIFGVATCNLHIIAKSSHLLTQQERDDTIIKPRLIPIYEVLIHELARERWFSFSGPHQIKHRPLIVPFWTMGDSAGTDVKNYFNMEVDDYVIADLELPIRSQNCKTAGYSPTNGNGYPSATNILSFFDDIELIVDGGDEGDPVSGATSVIVPAIKGKKYSLWQRGIGELRQKRIPEIADDTVNGGFSFTNDYVFQKGETFFIKIRPQFISSTSGLTGTVKNNVDEVFIEQN